MCILQFSRHYTLYLGYRIIHPFLARQNCISSPHAKKKKKNLPTLLIALRHLVKKHFQIICRSMNVCPFHITQLWQQHTILEVRALCYVWLCNRFQNKVHIDFTLSTEKNVCCYQGGANCMCYINSSVQTSFRLLILIFSFCQKSLLCI